MKKDNQQSLASFFKFSEEQYLLRALSHKTQEQEYIQKHNTPYPHGINDEWVILGHQLLEFLFMDHLISNGYPNQCTKIKKMSDILTTRQQLFTDKNFSDFAIKLKINDYVKVGRQLQLKNNPKVLSDCYKALIAAHYMDQGQDMEQVKEIVRPFFEHLLDKFQGTNQQIQVKSFKSQFYELLSRYPTITPRIECVLIQESHLVTSRQYQFTLHVGNFYNNTVQGRDKRKTEEVMYQHFLKRAKDLIENNRQVLLQENASITDEDSQQFLINPLQDITMDDIIQGINNASLE